MTFLKTLARAAGLGLCVAALSGTALADPGNGNGNGPATTPPGQEQKAETPAAAAPAPAPQAAQGQAQKAENQAKQDAKKAEQAAKKAAPKPAAKSKSNAAAAKAAAPGQKKKAEKAAKPATPSKGQSANAHHHVIVCHRTGSLSNPYVVINIPYTAWTHGHSTHPARNGHSDKLLKDPASRPGSKDGFDKSACGGAGAPAPTQVTQAAETKSEAQACPTTVTTTEQVLVGVWHATGAVKNGERKFVYITPSVNSAHYDRTKHPDDKPVYETRTVTRTVSAENCAAVTPTSSPTTLSAQSDTQISSQVSPSAPANVQPTAVGAPAVGGVAGAVSPAGAAQPEAEEDKPAGGVLGAIASAPEAVAETATSGTLPFTGIPLWIAALIGSALLATGLVLRRSA